MSEQRKTLDERYAMTELDRLRHSCAHVLASAILRIWPQAQFAAGPPVENGFYYDLELDHRISLDDFERIEAEMKKIVKENQPFEKIEVSRERALAMAREGRLGALGPREQPSKFKLDILEHIPEGEAISLYRNGDFTDLCAGPHVMRTGNIGAFKLTSVASAYYKGDASNPQLQRGYGTAFKNRTQMDAHFADEGCSSAQLANLLEKGELDGYLLKPMNCPMHIKIYASELRSYRDLPVRLSEFGTVYRWEQSGELGGMTRVRGFTQDDGHLFCTEEQLSAELRECLELGLNVLWVLGLNQFRARIGLRDPDSSKYVGTPTPWDKAEAALKQIAAQPKISFTEEDA